MLARAPVVERYVRGAEVPSVVISAVRTSCHSAEGQKVTRFCPSRCQRHALRPLSVNFDRSTSVWPLATTRGVHECPVPNALTVPPRCCRTRSWTSWRFDGLAISVGTALRLPAQLLHWTPSSSSYACLLLI